MLRAHEHVRRVGAEDAEAVVEDGRRERRIAHHRRRVRPADGDGRVRPWGRACRRRCLRCGRRPAGGRRRSRSPSRRRGPPARPPRRGPATRSACAPRRLPEHLQQHRGAVRRLGAAAAAGSGRRRRPPQTSRAGTRASATFLACTGPWAGSAPPAMGSGEQSSPAPDATPRARLCSGAVSLPPIEIDDPADERLARLSPAQGAPPQRRRRAVRRRERARRAPPAGQRPARVVGAADRAAAGDAGRRARGAGPVPRLPRVAGDAGRDRRLPRPPWLPGHRRAPAARAAAARRARAWSCSKI